MLKEEQARQEADEAILKASKKAGSPPMSPKSPTGVAEGFTDSPDTTKSASSTSVEPRASPSWLIMCANDLGEYSGPDYRNQWPMIHHQRSIAENLNEKATNFYW
jgi:hypothetical protein